jgi:hypothetical protein
MCDSFLALAINGLSLALNLVMMATGMGAAVTL